jgi:hypothetical protein
MTDALVTSNGSAFRGLIGAAREDITPPVGIYARCWGAATHEVARGIHRPLTLTCLTFQANADDPPLVLLAADLMSWRSREDEWAVRSAILQALALDESRLMFCFSHTHSAPSLRSDDATRPGGHLIEPYRAHLRDSAIRAAQSALAQRRPATLSWRYGRCDLATNRDLHEPGGKRSLCGFNPQIPADDTLLVGRACEHRTGRVLATIVNYACHPTTLAWKNELISPDYIGAMRDMIESHTESAPCLFLQGASGELAPAEQYTGDPAVADRHGRRLGFAVLSTLEAMEAAGARLVYEGVVESGAPLAVWRQEAAPVSNHLAAELIPVELPLKLLPSVGQLEQEWRQTEDPVLKDRLRRKWQVRRIVGDGSTSRMPLWVWRIGDAFLIGQPNELYSRFQTALRERRTPRAVAVMNLVNGSAGYLAPREMYATDGYQIVQSPFAAGAFEQVHAAAEAAVTSLEKR